MSERVVCNTGPLIALAGVGQLDLLQKLFSEVLVPEAVRREVEAGGIAGLGKDALQKAPWIRVRPLLGPEDVLLAALLDAGEAAVISLARQESVDLVLVDEVKARRVARDTYGMRVIGTGRTLVEGKRRGHLSAVRPLLDRMQANGYWIAPNIVAEILRVAGE